MSLASSPITFGGLASGMDTNSIVAKLVQIEQEPMTQLQAQVQNETTQQNLVKSISTQVSALSTALQNLQNPDALDARTATVDSGAPFTATASDGAPTGSYNVMIDQLASAQRTYSNAVSTSDSAANMSGTISLTMGGTTKSVQVASTDSLTDIANNINNAGLDLSAAVVYDGTNYHLVINGNQTGASNAITISDNTGLGLGLAANTAQAAQDTVAYVDGMKVNSATNTITGIIPGVTLTANGLSAGSKGDGQGLPVSKGGNVTESSVTVAQDQSQIASGLQAVVSAYNAVMSVVTQQFAAPPSTDSSDDGTDSSGNPSLSTAPLVGDSTIQELQSTLLSLPSMAGGPAGNAYSSLVDLGISVDDTGNMTLDTSQLQTAEQNDPQAVTDLLAGTANTPGLMATLSNTLNTYTDFVTGSLTIEAQSIGDQITDDNNTISQMQLQSQAYQTQIQNEFNNMEQLISSYNSQGSALTAMNSSLFGNSSTSGSSGSSSSNSGSSGSSSS